MRFLSGSLLLVLAAMGAGCSFRPLAIHPLRIKVAQPDFSSTPIGGVNPNLFVKTWNFSSNDGYLYDAAKAEISGGVVKHRLRQFAVFPYSIDRVVIETTDGHPFKTLESFSDSPGAKNLGEIRYQLSHDGMHWFFHDGRHWQETVLNQSNTNSSGQVGQKIRSFPVEAGVGGLWVRIFLISKDGKHPAELEHVTVTGEQPSLDYHPE